MDADAAEAIAEAIVATDVVKAAVIAINIKRNVEFQTGLCNIQTKYLEILFNKYLPRIHYDVTIIGTGAIT